MAEIILFGLSIFMAAWAVLFGVISVMAFFIKEIDGGTWAMLVMATVFTAAAAALLAPS